MKKLLTICAILISTQCFSQIAGHLELNKPTTRGAKGVELGAGLQYPVTIDYQDKILIGANLSFRYLVGGGEGVQSFSVPLLAVGRYYVYGKHGCSGGAYLEANAGARLQQNSVKILGERFSESNVVPEIAVGLGYRGGMGYDFGFRMAWGFLDGNSLPFFRFRLGYTF